MTNRTSISHTKKDKDYILELMDKAKLKQKMPIHESFSALAISCMIEYLEHIIDKD